MRVIFAMGMSVLAIVEWDARLRVISDQHPHTAWISRPINWNSFASLSKMKSEPSKI